MDKITEKIVSIVVNVTVLGLVIIIASFVLLMGIFGLIKLNDLLF